MSASVARRKIGSMGYRSVYTLRLFSEFYLFSGAVVEIAGINPARDAMSATLNIRSPLPPRPGRGCRPCTPLSPTNRPFWEKGKRRGSTLPPAYVERSQHTLPSPPAFPTNWPAFALGICPLGGILADQRRFQ